ncbi:4-alpha-glucanotransferase [Streptomyces apocyni]|uniref:4-alpha-glucanotransferase n=1 Tax=Streptomyces apocyni TaxID=2654677 RepID=UPI0012E9E896|nr:4-alpha-glucanotransferase [Streptomyces apocyni]
MPRPREREPGAEPLDLLAARYGVATSYEPSPGRTVRAEPAAVVAVLAALGVDASTPDAIRAALTAREAELRERLLPPTLVAWAPVGPVGPVASGEPVAPVEPSPELVSPPLGALEKLAGLPTGTRLWVRTEQGDAAGWVVPEASGGCGAPGTSEAAGVSGASGDGVGGPRLPLGVHEVGAEAPDGRRAQAYLVVAPERMPAPGERAHGLLVQLYSLLSRRSWGMGDLGDLADLAAWSGRALGTGFVQVNPLHASVPGGPGGPTDPSPYRPSSRRFPDPVHLRVEDIPEYVYLAPEARQEAAELLARAAILRQGVLNEGALIDRDAVWALKSRALELLREVPLSPGRRAAYCDFLAEQGEPLEAYATWCALAERYGSDWPSWPSPLRDPASPGTARARAGLMERIDFHCWLGWLTDAQLAAAQRAALDAGMAIGLVHDLAVGVHPGGADAWARREFFAAGMSVGAPPDAFSADGQDWGLPPWRPDALAASGYAPFRDLLRGLLRHAGALRIDHVMGLFRLWWVPAGRPPTEGAYVHYDADAMLAVLALEAHRAGAAVIGEDLGTVAPGVREALAARGVLGTSVLWFERDWDGTGRPLPPDRWRADCLATVTTHDLPPTAARLSGEHIRLHQRLGLLTGPLSRATAEGAAETGEWLAVLARLGLLPGGRGARGEEEKIRAVYRFLARTPARMVGVWLPDAVGDRRPQNVPGTWRTYPNWRLPIADATGRAVTLEELAASPRLHRLMAELRGL